MLPKMLIFTQGTATLPLLHWIFIFSCFKHHFLSIYLFIYLSLYLSIYLSFYLSLFLSLYLSHSLSISLSISTWFLFSAFRTAWQLLVVLLTGTAACTISTLFVPQLMAVTPEATRIVVACRVSLAAALSLLATDVTKKAQFVDINKPDNIFSYYMHIWNVFYACYFLLPLVR